VAIEDGLMTFEQWMKHRGLSESSVRKYAGAIGGALSEWAIEAALMEGPLTSIQSSRRFQSIAIELRKLPIYQERNERGHSMYNSALVKYTEYLYEGFDSDVETDVEAILEDESVTNTEKATLIKTRIGQGNFRQKLIAYWNGCAVTGYEDTSMLVASHIKPWCVSSNLERLDIYNGLLLLPTLDKAFDSGLISFDEKGNILISPFLQDPEKLGVISTMNANLNPKHGDYMKFHREQIFRNGHQ
jgi:putative restriction endonuclease